MDELVSSVLGDGGALAEPVDDQIGDLEIVLVIMWPLRARQRDWTNARRVG
jgi:hypothetical protein